MMALLATLGAMLVVLLYGGMSAIQQHRDRLVMQQLYGEHRRLGTRHILRDLVACWQGASLSSVRVVADSGQVLVMVPTSLLWRAWWRINGRLFDVVQFCMQQSVVPAGIGLKIMLVRRVRPPKLPKVSASRRA